MFYSITIIAILLAVLYIYFTRTFDYWKKRNVIGPKPLPFVGNLKDSFFRRKSLIIVNSSIYEAFPNEKVVGIYRMTTPCLLLRDLDVIKNVMIKDFDLFADRGIEFSDEGLGVNLFHADGERWRVLRNRFTPLFTSGKLKNMLPLMTECGDKFVDYVDDICQTQPEQSMHLVFQQYTMASIAACAFGVDLDKQMVKTLEKIDKLVFTVNYGIELDMMYPGILKKLNSSLFPKEVTTFFENLTKKVIDQRLGVPSNRKDFIDLVLELRQEKTIAGAKRKENEDAISIELSDSIIAAQTFVFYVAGYETGASVLSYLFYELAKNPDIQDKLITEIDNALKKEELNYECLSKMTYLNQVLDETLRKYPMGDLVLRNSKTEYTIPDTNVTISKGQTVIVSVWGVHHDPKHYPDPDVFDPERFSTENIKNRHSCAYLAFGVGPRNCLGKRFAKLQSQVCIVKFLSKFRVEMSKKTPLHFKYDPMRLFAFPTGGIHLNIVRRQV